MFNQAQIAPNHGSAPVPRHFWQTVVGVARGALTVPRLAKRLDMVFKEFTQSEMPLNTVCSPVAKETGWRLRPPTTGISTSHGGFLEDASTTTSIRCAEASHSTLQEVGSSP